MTDGTQTLREGPRPVKWPRLNGETARDRYEIRDGYAESCVL